MVGSEETQSLFVRLKAKPATPGVKNLQQEVTKLQTLRTLALPAEALADVLFKVLQLLKRCAHHEDASRMHTHLVPIRYTLLASFVHVRTMEVTDGAIRMTLEVIRRIGAQTEKHLEKTLLQDIKRVTGKVQLLYRIAEAVVKAPDGTIRNVLLPCVKDDPRHMGYLPYGEEERPAKVTKSPKTSGPKPQPKGPEWELGDAMRTLQFYELGILHFCRCMCHAIPLVHIVPYAIRSGLSPTTAASILSAIGVFSFLGRIIWGILADRWGPKPAYVLAVFQQGFMMVWLLGTTHPVMFFLFAFFWGIGYGGAMPPYALFVKG